MDPVVVVGTGMCMALLAWVGPVPVALARTVPPTGRPELQVSGLRWRIQHVSRAAVTAVGSAFAVLAALWLPVAVVSGAVVGSGDDGIEIGAGDGAPVLAV